MESMKPFNYQHKHLILIIVFLFLPLLSSCDNRQEKEEIPVKSNATPFIIGLIPEQELFSQKKRYEPLADYLAKKTGLAVELKILSRYGNIIDNFISNKMDAAFFGSFTGALAIKKLAVQPIARPEWQDGTSTYYGLIFVRKDSGIKNIKDMKGKRFAWVDKSTTAGWLVPLYYFKLNGIEDPHTSYLKECYFCGTHEDTILDVLNGRADIGAAKNTVFYRLAKTDKRIVDELEILMESTRVPANSFGIAEHVSASTREMLTKALLGMSEDPEGQVILANFGARRFIATDVQDYDPVFEYAEKVGIDLLNYDYFNN